MCSWREGQKTREEALLHIEAATSRGTFWRELFFFGTIDVYLQTTLPESTKASWRYNFLCCFVQGKVNSENGRKWKTQDARDGKKWTRCIQFNLLLIIKVHLLKRQQPPFYYVPATFSPYLSSKHIMCWQVQFLILPLFLNVEGSSERNNFFPVSLLKSQYCVRKTRLTDK